MRAETYRPGPPTVETAQRGLEASRRGAEALARRARRFSWLCWGFLFALALGELLLVTLELLFAPSTLSGSSTSTTGAAWGPFLSYGPAGVLLGLAVRELLVGRREARDGPGAVPTTEGSPAAPSWIEEVRAAQQRLTRAASEIEWSFVPLVLGCIALAELAAALALSVTGPSTTATAVVLPGLLGLAIGVLPLWPLYRIAQQWIRFGQERLELQSRELAQLEAEFLWRFIGSGAAP